MLSLIVVIFLVVVLFKLTGLMFRIAGRVLGLVLGLFGWMLLAGLAVTVLGLAVYSIPVLLGVGAVAMITQRN